MEPNLEPVAPLVFRLADGRRIKLTAEVVNRLQQYAQHAPNAAEAGGVLLGRYLCDSNDVVVDDLTEPLPGDKRGRYSFHRAQKAHQQAIEQAWQTSNGTRTYLGEWHTHPEARPTPSCIDTCDWRRKLHQDQYFDQLFFFIVGTQQVRGWSGSRSRPKLVPLECLPLG
jgi:integrative and conjugative element protein (TIGR02256 family)